MNKTSLFLVAGLAACGFVQAGQPLITPSLVRFFEDPYPNESSNQRSVLQELSERYLVARSPEKRKLAAPTLFAWLLCADDEGDAPQAVFANVMDMAANFPQTGQALLLDSMPFVLSFEHASLGSAGKKQRAKNVCAMLRTLVARQEKELIRQLLFTPRYWPREGERDDNGDLLFDTTEEMGLRYFMNWWFKTDYLRDEEMASLFDLLCNSVDKEDVKAFFCHKPLLDVPVVIFDIIAMESPRLVQSAVVQAVRAGGGDLLRVLLADKKNSSPLLPFLFDQRRCSFPNLVEREAMAAPFFKAVEECEQLDLLQMTDSKGRNFVQLVADYMKKHPNETASPALEKYLLLASSTQKDSEPALEPPLALVSSPELVMHVHRKNPAGGRLYVGAGAILLALAGSLVVRVVRPRKQMIFRSFAAPMGKRRIFFQGEKRPLLRLAVACVAGGVGIAFLRRGLGIVFA